MPRPRTIRSERLELRLFEPRDTDALHAQWTLPAVRRYLWDDVVIERELAAEVVGASEESFSENGYGLFVLCERGAEDIVGFCGLRDWENPRSGREARPEILYGLDPAHWRRGYAREAAIAVLRFGFDACDLDRIDGGIDPPNGRSRRVLEGLGFENWARVEVGGLPADFAELARAKFLSSDAASALYEID